MRTTGHSTEGGDGARRRYMLRGSPLFLGHVVIAGYLQDIQIVYAKYVAGVRYERVRARVRVRAHMSGLRAGHCPVNAHVP